MGEIYTERVLSNDPSMLLKKIATDSCNYLHDKNRENKEGWYSKIYFSISIILTLIVSKSLLNWISVLVLMNILIVFLIFFAIRYKKERRTFWKNRENIEQSYNELGMKFLD